MSASLHIAPVSSDAEWQHVQQIRTKVFIEEQACPPEEEWDEFDQTSRHLLGWVGENPVATSRWRVVTHNETPFAKLERFAVLATFRGCGYGKEMIQATLEDALRAGYPDALLHAQAHLQALYGAFGFVPIGDLFDEAGIPHITMIRPA